MTLQLVVDGEDRTTRLPGAASRSLGAVLGGPCGPARLLAVFPSAVYLSAPDGTVLALVTTDAVRLPNAVVVAADRGTSPFTALRASARTPALCGAGAVRVGPLAVRAARWWTPRRPRPAHDPRTVRAAADELDAAFRSVGGPSPGLPRTGRAALLELVGHAARGDHAAAATAADRLVGLGPGLTPSGDDVLSGFLLALRHLGTEAEEEAWLGHHVATHATGRTTDLSAALLGHAARGDGCDQVVDLVDAVAGNTPVGRALNRLLRVGHTSGADLGLGVLAGAHAALARRRTRRNAPWNARRKEYA